MSYYSGYIDRWTIACKKRDPMEIRLKIGKNWIEIPTRKIVIYFNQTN